MEKTMMWMNNPFIWGGICLLGGLIFARKKYQKWVALVYLLVHSIEVKGTDKVKEFANSLVKKDLRKELDDVLVLLGYKNREALEGDKPLEEIDKERLYKKFPELELKNR